MLSFMNISMFFGTWRSVLKLKPEINSLAVFASIVAIKIALSSPILIEYLYSQSGGIFSKLKESQLSS